MKTAKKRMNKNKSWKNRKYQRGGAISDKEKEEMKSYIQLIDAYVQKQTEKGMNTGLESVKYALFKEKFDEFEKIKVKMNEAPDSIEQDDIKKMKSMVFFILKDEVSGYELLFDESAAGFQVWINNFIMSLINDTPFEEEVRMKLLQGSINKKPYVKVSYDKNTNNVIFDVNELLASIQTEIKGNPMNKIISEKILKANGVLEPVP